MYGLTCKTCRHYRPEKGQDEGTCRRYPPVPVVIHRLTAKTVDSEAVWPIVYDADYCGEWTEIDA